MLRNSLITEIIKKKELEKIFDFEKNNEIIDVVEKIYLKKNIKNKDEFIKILEKFKFRL